VVLISGEDDRILHTAEKLARAHALRVLGALHKPVGPEQLRQTLADAMQPAATQNSHNVLRQYGADEIREAIAGGELVNHYQPKVEFATGRVSGVETLVRWQHPRDGLVYPDQFVSVAEESGLIDNLTRAVLAGLGGALQQARQWQDAGYPLHVSVNVSMDNLTDHAFPGFVADEVARAGVPASRLVLEVTESRLMKNPLATLDILTRLRLKRIGLSIDDFGTGHSSLSQLRDVPFDELKIDRSFVHGACRQDALRAILQPSLDMARQLGIRSVAEGVEDLDDWRFLRECGCDLAQGYFVARPMPAGALIGWLAEWEARRGALLD
jgi:EAL domain-containing protein (putative c-di-GMP-specific phosphodiesterase class I)